MSFPRYEKYKDSGVEWLGEVPAHWDAMPIKRLASLQSGESITAESIEEEGDFPVYGGNGLRGYASKFTHEGEYALIGRQGALCGNVNYATGQFWASEHAVVVSPTRPLIMKWIGEVLRVMNLNQYSVSAAQPGLSVDMVSRLAIPVPPLSEQQGIATFLHHETAKIDALVEEQRLLIELLKEKRQAMISQAVTKGLNSNVAMKDSGVTWVGRVPAHWELCPLRKAFTAMDYGISESLDGEGAVAVLRMGNIGGGKVSLQDLKYTDAVDPYLLLRAGDLLFNRTNSLDQIGKVGLFVGDGEATTISFASYLVRLRTSPSCVPEFFGFLLNCPGMLAEARANAIVAIGQCNLNPTRYGAFAVAIPPREDQLRIAEFLKAACAQLDELTREAEAARTLLYERCAALICAAVTGKIDVRGLAPQSEAVAA